MGISINNFFFQPLIIRGRLQKHKWTFFVVVACHTTCFAFGDMIEHSLLVPGLSCTNCAVRMRFQGFSSGWSTLNDFFQSKSTNFDIFWKHMTLCHTNTEKIKIVKMKRRGEFESFLVMPVQTTSTRNAGYVSICEALWCRVKRAITRDSAAAYFSLWRVCGCVYSEWRSSKMEKDSRETQTNSYVLWWEANGVLHLQTKTFKTLN